MICPNIVNNGGNLQSSWSYPLSEKLRLKRVESLQDFSVSITSTAKINAIIGYSMTGYQIRKLRIGGRFSINYGQFNQTLYIYNITYNISDFHNFN